MNTASGQMSTEAYKPVNTFSRQARQEAFQERELGAHRVSRAVLRHIGEAKCGVLRERAGAYRFPHRIGLADMLHAAVCWLMSPGSRLAVLVIPAPG